MTRAEDVLRSGGGFDADAAAQPGTGIFGLPHSIEEAGVVVVPVPFEATTSYGGGTVDGPAAVWSASRQVDLFDLEMGRAYRRGIAMLEESAEVRAWNDEARGEAAKVIARGGVNGDPGLAAAAGRVNELGARLNEWLRGTVAEHLGRGKLVATVGGDHSVAFGAIAATAERHPGMGVLQLDAHADLRDAYEGFVWSHASIMYNVCERIPGVARLVQVGIRDVGESEYQYITESGGRVIGHFDAVLAEERMGGANWAAQVRRIVEGLPPKVYLSFDIDGLDPTLCPHTGTPVPGGLDFAMVCHLVAAVARSGRTIVGLDLVEVAPGTDGDEWDGNVGARLLYKMIGWALRSQGFNS
jgi:agmatinase